MVTNKPAVSLVNMFSGTARGLVFVVDRQRRPSSWLRELNKSNKPPSSVQKETVKLQSCWPQLSRRLEMV